MFVCVCRAVTDRQIHAAVEGGAGSLDDLARSLGVGTGCGRCLDHAADVIAACGRGPVAIGCSQGPVTLPA